MRFIRLSRRTVPSLFVSCLLAALVWLPQKADAALMQNIVNLNTNQQIGSITFPSESGSGTAGVTFFIDNVTPLFFLGSFTEAHITSLSWSLDPKTWNVSTLELRALKSVGACSPTPQPGCGSQTFMLQPNAIVDLRTIECQIQGCATGLELDVPIAFRHSQAQVAEPASLALLAVALIGLGVAVRRRAA